MKMKKHLQVFFHFIYGMVPASYTIINERLNKMRGMNFATDCDETIVFGTVWYFHQFLGKKYNKVVTINDLNNFILWEKYFGITQRQVIKSEGEFYETKEYQNMRLDPQALKVLWMIKGHRLCKFGDVVTSRFQEHELATRTLLPPGLIRKKVHTSHQSKIDNYDFSQVRFYFEDSVKHACDVAQLNPDMDVFILRQSWNKVAIDRYEDVPLPNVHIVSNWYEINEIVTPILLAA